MALALPPDALHLWFAYPDDIQDEALLSRYQGLLTGEETARWQRFYFAGHRHQYLVTRALIRSTLSLYVDKDPKDWRFQTNPYGKPEIADSPLPIRFNLSHTDGLVMCAVVLEADIGVDTENTQKTRASADIADHYFAKAEIAALARLDGAQKQQRFFDYWTLKEAYIKARGLGLSLPLDQFSFVLAENQPVQIAFEPGMQDNPDHWQFWQLRPSPAHIAAVAVKANRHQGFRLTMNKVVPLQGYAPLVEK